MAINIVIYISANKVYGMLCYFMGKFEQIFDCYHIFNNIININTRYHDWSIYEILKKIDNGNITYNTLITFV